jgi:hypothetical protein
LFVCSGTGAMPLVDTGDNVEGALRANRTKYPMDAEYAAHCIIFYTGNDVHMTSAKDMEVYLKIGLHLNVKLVQLSERKNNFLHHLEDGMFHILLFFISG